MTRVRCAVYTRKSSEEGLAQRFNSLDAQREACLAYIESQRHEGWCALPTVYDDGGWSGGTLARPAVTRLLADVDAGRLDTIVVYKVDRLTRSLADFARIVERLDAAGVSFVSITQQFSTTSSMGRLTLNVLLSFAQFEREVTGERIRDKIAASKCKGMWMGGNVPLGYDLHDRHLLVNAEEADRVRLIFRLYLELTCVHRLTVELATRGLRSKVRVHQTGRTSGGHAFGRGALYAILKNRLYRGEIAHRGAVYPGQQAAIVPPERWDAVQAVLAANNQAKRTGVYARDPSLLAGLLVDDRGHRLTPTRSGGGHATGTMCPKRSFRNRRRSRGGSVGSRHGKLSTTSLGAWRRGRPRVVNCWISSRGRPMTQLRAPQCSPAPKPGRISGRGSPHKSGPFSSPPSGG